MSQIIRRMAVIVLAAAAAAMAAWMVWPRSLGDSFRWERGEVRASIIISGVKTVRDDGALLSLPYHDMESYTLAAGSPQAEAVMAVLEKYTWHPCLDTLTRNSHIEGIGKVTVSLYGETDLSVFSGTGKARVNGQTVRLGYWGSGKAASLCQELTTILRGE